MYCARFYCSHGSSFRQGGQDLAWSLAPSGFSDDVQVAFLPAAIACDRQQEVLRDCVCTPFSLVLPCTALHTSPEALQAVWS